MRRLKNVVIFFQTVYARCVIMTWCNSEGELRQEDIPIISVRDNKSNRSNKKAKKKKKTKKKERNKGVTHAIVKVKLCV